MSKMILGFGLVLITLTNCTRTQWVAAVGERRISKATVELREKMMKTFDPNMNEKMATDQMISFELKKNILEKNGQTISDGEISAFLERQKNEAKKNPVMASFLEQYSKDPAFKDVYLYPQVVEERARQVYDKDEAYHKKELELVNNVLQRAKADPAQFEAVARELGLPVLKGTLNAQTGMIQWEPGRDVASQSKVPADKAWFVQSLKQNYLQKTEVGKMAGSPWPIYFGYLLIRLDKISKDEHHFSMAVAPRKAPWVWEKENTMTVNVVRFSPGQKK